VETSYLSVKLSTQKRKRTDIVEYYGIMPLLRKVQRKKQLYYSMLAWCQIGCTSSADVSNVQMQMEDE